MVYVLCNAAQPDLLGERRDARRPARLGAAFQHRGHRVYHDGAVRRDVPRPVGKGEGSQARAHRRRLLGGVSAGLRRAELHYPGDGIDRAELHTRAQPAGEGGAGMRDTNVRKLRLLIEICLLAWLLTGSARYEAKKEIPVNTPEFDWENYNIITHALGGIDGLTYLNSRESFINYYDKGCRLFEVDLTQTSDGVWVCRHNWKESLGQWKGEERKVLSSEEFLNTPIYGKYTPMTFEDLLKLLDEYPDAFVMIDSKQYSVRNYQRTLEDYAQYREISIKAGIEHTLKQIIPEIYNSAMYPGTALLYKFPAYIYSLWQEYTTEELNDIAEFCQTNKIMAVTIYRDYWSEEVQKIFDERDILVYIYTINDKEEARRYLANGAQGVCTDVLITDNLN